MNHSMISHSKHLHMIGSDITKVTEGIIIQGCNAQGVMGSGVAKQLRAKYPDVYMDYLSFLEGFKEDGSDPMGGVGYFQATGTLLIANCITQKFYGRDGKKYVSYDALDFATYQVASYAKHTEKVIHVPWLIGAGLGGGDLNICHQILESNFKENQVVYHHWKWTIAGVAQW